MTDQRRPRRIDHEYFVLWNTERRSFDIDCDGRSTSQFAYDKSTAIGIAIREAQNDARLGLRAVVKSINNGAVRVEWSSP